MLLPATPVTPEEDNLIDAEPLPVAQKARSRPRLPPLALPISPGKRNGGRNGPAAAAPPAQLVSWLGRIQHKIVSINYIQEQLHSTSALQFQHVDGTDSRCVSM